MKTLLSLLIFLNVAEFNLEAQRPEKGSMPGHEWRNEVQEKPAPKSDTVYSYYSELSFGNWKFRAAYRYPEVISIDNHSTDVSNNKRTGLFENSNIVQRNLKKITSNIMVTCIEPADCLFTMQFDLLDSTYESFQQKIGFTMDEKIQPTENYSQNIYSKQFTGFLGKPGDDSIPFDIAIRFSGPTRELSTLLFTGTDSIRIKKLFNKQHFTGLEFYESEKLIGSVYRKTLSSSYRYWLSSQTTINTQETIAALIFIIVAFVK